MSEAEAKRLRRLLDEQEPFPHDALMDEYKADIWAEIEANPPELRSLDDPGIDAESAYRMYMFYTNCSIVPRTEMEVDMGLERIEHRIGLARTGNLEGLERRVDLLLSSFELCSNIPPEVDCRVEAIQWMALAAQLGHEIAQVEYYDKGMGILLRPRDFNDGAPLALQSPGLVASYKETARMALNRAMEKGHPEAYLAMSSAYMDGVIFRRNLVEALAYARAAENRTIRNQIILHRATRLANDIARHLTREQVAEAEALALQLKTETGASP